VNADLGGMQDKKHRFRQSDNIVHFLNFIRNIGMPEVSTELRLRHGPGNDSKAPHLDLHLRNDRFVQQEEYAQSHILHSRFEVSHPRSTGRRAWTAVNHRLQQSSARATRNGR
jgi:hypothetical protein